MITYNDFLKGIKGIPSEEEFNKVVSALPPFESFPEDFEYDGDYDRLDLKLADCIFGSYAYTDDIDIETKRIWAYEFESLGDLESAKEYFKEYGWTLESYEEEKERLLEEQQEAETVKKTSPILYKLQHSETIEEFKKNLKDAYEESLTW